jgi:hypothetical protein
MSPALPDGRLGWPPRNMLPPDPGADVEVGEIGHGAGRSLQHTPGLASAGHASTTSVMLREILTVVGSRAPSNRDPASLLEETGKYVAAPQSRSRTTRSTRNTRLFGAAARLHHVTYRRSNLGATGIAVYSGNFRCSGTAQTMVAHEGPRATVRKSGSKGRSGTKQVEW